MNWFVHRLLLALTLLLSLRTLVRAESGDLTSINNVLIGADRAVRRVDTAELTGNVQLIFQGQHLSADRALVRFSEKIVQATGHVLIQNATSTLEATEIVWNFETNTGVAYHATLTSGQVFLEGEVIQKTGDNKYFATRAKYTACSTCPPGWEFSGRRIEAELGGYAHINSSTLRFSSVPVLWLPYLVVPLKSKRQTGLLAPTFGFEQGFSYDQRFFWAISKSQDATFGGKFYQRRGVKGSLNYRYVLNKESSGELNTAFIRDRYFAKDPIFSDGSPVGEQGSAVNRWFFRYNHQYYMPDGFSQKTNLDVVRDLRYPRDFADDMKNQGEPALDNRVSVAKNTQSTHASLDSSYYINLLQDNPLADNRSAVHRLPELRYSLLDRPIDSTPFIYNLDLKYSNFVRGMQSFDRVKDNTSGSACDGYDRCLDDSAGASGPFQPKRDLVRAGQRFTLQPSLAAPFQIGPYFEIEPRTTLTHNQYQLSVDPALPQAAQDPSDNEFNSRPSLTYIRNDLAARTRFSQVYGDSLDPLALRWKHSFEPEVFYTTVPYLRQSSTRFFGPLSSIPDYRRDQAITDDDFNYTDRFNSAGIQFDYNDRVYSRNVAGVVLHNYLTRKVVTGSTTEYKRVVRFDIGENYDYDEDRKGADIRRSYGPVNALLDVRFENFNTYTTASFYPYHQVTNFNSRAMLNDRIKFVQLSYNQNFPITQRTPADFFARTETVGMSVGFIHKYLRLSAGVTYSLVESNYGFQSWDYALDIIPPGNCLAVSITMTQPVTGEITQHISFDFKYDGKG